MVQKRVKSEADHLANASNHIQSVFQRYRKGILEFGNDVLVNPTDVSYIGFMVSARRNRRIAAFTIGKQSFKVWLHVEPGTLHDPNHLTQKTKAGHTITIRDDKNFDYIVGLLQQSYVRNKTLAS